MLVNHSWNRKIREISAENGICIFQIVSSFLFFPQRLRFEYLLRIDALSASSSNPEQEFGSSVRVEEDASLPGFIHLKILGIGAKEIWREYVDVAGRLRRDLVKARLANLLATSIKQGIFHSNQLFKGCVCVHTCTFHKSFLWNAIWNLECGWTDRD